MAIGAVSLAPSNVDCGSPNVRLRIENDEFIIAETCIDPMEQEPALTGSK